MIGAAERSGKLFRVCENFRYYPPYNKALQLMEEGAIGEPLSIRVKVLSGSPQHGWAVSADTWRWRFTEAQCGGGPAVWDHGYHIFSIVTYFLGPVEKVFAWIEWQEVAPGLVLDAPAVLMWKHREKMRYGSWETLGSHELMVRSKYYAGDEWVEITGSRGVIWVNRCSGEMLEGPAVVLYRDGETHAHPRPGDRLGSELPPRGARTSSPPSAKDAPAHSPAPRRERCSSSPWPPTARRREGRPVLVDEIVD